MVLVHVSLVSSLSFSVHELLNLVVRAQDVTVAVASIVGVDKHALSVVSSASVRDYQHRVLNLLSGTWALLSLSSGHSRDSQWFWLMCNWTVVGSNGPALL
jgi:hypothetical protein